VDAVYIPLPNHLPDRTPVVERSPENALHCWWRKGKRQKVLHIARIAPVAQWIEQWFSKSTRASRAWRFRPSAWCVFVGRCLLDRLERGLELVEFLVCEFAEVGPLIVAECFFDDWWWLSDEWLGGAGVVGERGDESFAAACCAVPPVPLLDLLALTVRFRVVEKFAPPLGCAAASVRRREGQRGP
jgi:hypothetical protein